VCDAAEDASDELADESDTGLAEFMIFAESKSGLVAATEFQGRGNAG
jgi:hypothetical protein